jgi:hypothetical protein
MNKVLSSTKFVVDNSKNVKINKNKIREFCKNYKKTKISNWLDDFKPFNNLNEEEKLNFLLIINSMNFCFWGNPKWKIEYNGKEFDGGFAMLNCLERALNKNIPILDSNYLKTISIKDFKEIMKGNIEIPLLKERFNIFREIGASLEKNKLSEILKKSNNNLSDLILLIIDNFPSFNDKSIYSGKDIYFYKRVQLLIFDIIYFFKDKYINPKLLYEITACADYKLPQTLRKLGILVYSEELNKSIDTKIEIKKNSEIEIEIRASTVWAVEYIKEILKDKFLEITAIEIDCLLWNLGQIKSSEDKPYHLTRTTAY